LNKFKWEIIGLSETHWLGTEDRKVSDYRILQCGNSTEHRAGVGLILNKNAATALLSFLPINERILTARFKIDKGYLTVIQIYAPTSTSTEEEINEFYTQLQTEVSKINSADITILMGDFNAKVGNRKTLNVKTAVGKHGYGKRNVRGDMLVDFCAANSLFISNTFFQQSKASRYWTWESPDGVTHNQIDFIITNKRGMGCVRNCRTYPSADCGSDHQLLLANVKVRLKVKKPVSVKQRIDVGKLKNSEILNIYRQEMEIRWVRDMEILSDKRTGTEMKWNSIKEHFTQVAEDKIGKIAKRNSRSWLTDKTLDVAEQRRIAKSKRKESGEAKKHHNYLCREVKRLAKKDKEAFIKGQCEEVENCKKQNKSKEIYDGIRKITGKRGTSGDMIRDKHGVLLQSEEERNERWKEYFHELYNDPNPTLDSDLPNLPDYPNIGVEPEISLQEVEMSIKLLKSGKAAGIDGISSEEIKAACEGQGLTVLHNLCKTIWETETVPEEWKKAVIVPIFKKKDKTDCNNYRGVSLLCHCSKIFTRILLQRMRNRTEEILSEEQAGFRANRSTIDQIFTLRQMAEKYMEMNRDLYVGYIDFRKAFDSVWREGLWRVLRNYGFPEKIVRILENLYEGTISAVRTNTGITDWFETNVGVKQGCILSPMLFNVFLEAIMSRAIVEDGMGALVGGKVINNLRFADDIGNTNESQADLQCTMSKIAQEAEKMGMKINVEKTEVQHIGKNEEEIKININGQQLNQVSNFIYLGGVISSDGTNDKDIGRRIGLASGAMQSLNKIWSAADISKETKVIVYQALILSLLLYNSETWTLKEKDKQRLRVFEMMCLRRILGVTRRDRIRNTCIRETLDIQRDIVARITERRLKWYGHVMRMEECRLPYIALHGYVHGSRNTGRPRRRWIDGIRVDCKERGLTLQEAGRASQDRRHWRTVARLSMRT